MICVQTHFLCSKFAQMNISPKVVIYALKSEVYYDRRIDINLQLYHKFYIKIQDFFKKCTF